MVDWLPIQNAGNFSKEILHSDCSRPWWVYVETFLPCYLDLVLTLSVPDLNDLVRARAYQIAGPGRPGSHFRKRKLKGKKPAVKRWSMDKLKWLLIVTEPLELIGFTWLLYSATDDFFANWQSMILKTDYCTFPPNKGPFIRERHNFNNVISESGATMFLTDLIENPGGWLNTSEDMIAVAGSYKIILVADIAGRLADVPNVALQIRVRTSFGDRTFTGPFGTAYKDQPRQFMATVSWHTPAFGEQRFRWDVVGPPVLAGVHIPYCRVTIMRFA